MHHNQVLPDMTGVRPNTAISLVRFDPVKEMEVLRVRWKLPNFKITNYEIRTELSAQTTYYRPEV